MEAWPQLILAILEWFSVRTPLRFLPDTVWIIFHLDFTLENTDECSFNIYVEMEECCENLDKNTVDCDIMELIGGDMGVLNPRCTKNITMLYPNMVNDHAAIAELRTRIFLVEVPRIVI